MREADFQAEVIDTLQRDQRMVLKLDPGTGTIPKGWPDLLILSAGGHVLLAEVKVPGGKVEPQQRRHMELLALAGHNVCFIDPSPLYCVPTPMTQEEIHAYEPPPR